MQAVPWQVVDLPTDHTLLDIAFTDTDPAHGWIVGDKSTLLESRDAGINWELRDLQNSTSDYFLTSISFSGAEGWIVGQPKVMLHTEDEGTQWSQILLSEKLPGDPLRIEALGPQRAELVTNIGAIYQTEDGGKTWKAMVDDAVGVFKNISRRQDGAYLGVSSRGSFYFLRPPGSRQWQPFNRDTSRRIQNMGFGPDGKAWKLNQGAEIAFTDQVESGEWDKPIRPGRALSFGYLSAAFQDDHNIWVVGGSALLLHSPDQGQTWEEARLGKIPANFYTIEFMSPDQGFILGQRGALLRYVSTGQD